MSNGFDNQYRSLRDQGHGGWGGTKFQARLDGWRREISTLLASSTRPRDGGRVLELGCGNGAVAGLFATSGYQVTGVDISESALEWAREEFRRGGLRGEFHHADVTEGLTCFEDSTFDAVVDGNCLHCICGEGRSRAFFGIRRVLTPGGAFVLSSMCGEPRSLEAQDEFDSGTRCIVRAGKPYRYLPALDDLISEVVGSGFQVSQWRVQHNEWWDHLWLIALR